MLDLFNYLFGVNNGCRVECEGFFAWFPGGRVFYERAASFSYSLVANRRGGWKIFQILIGVEGVAGGREGLE